MCKDGGGSEYITTYRKMEKIGVDILEYDNVYMSLGIDHYTRFMFGNVVKTKEAKEIKENLFKRVKRWGVPEEFVVDPRTEIENKIIDKFCIERNIKKHVTSADNHQSNDTVERFNRTNREYFRKSSVDKEMNKEGLLGRAISSCNNSKHSVLYMTPTEVWSAGEDNEKIKTSNSKDSS